MATSEPLSCYLLTCNSQARLAQSLASVQGVADELIVVDSGSTDATEAIARSFGARVIHREFSSFSDQRSYAVSQCTHDWVLSLDSDEVASPALVARILDLKRAGFKRETTRPDAFGIRRHWYLLGRPVHCFYPSVCPDQPIRLFRGDSARYSPDRAVHENMTGFRRSEPIEEPIFHYTCDTIEQMYGKLNLYTTLAAKDFRQKGGQTGWLRIVVFPWLIWFRWYVLKGGWRDGWVGLVHGRYVRDMVYQKFLKARYDVAGEKHPSASVSRGLPAGSPVGAPEQARSSAISETH